MPLESWEGESLSILMMQAEIYGPVRCVNGKALADIGARETTG